MSRPGGEARRRRLARERKAKAPVPVASVRPRWPGLDAPLDAYCPDPVNHKACPKIGGGHDWCKPNPRPADHKYECAACGHYDLDDYI